MTKAKFVKLPAVVLVVVMAIALVSLNATVVPTNPNCSLSIDIAAIEHDEEERTVKIQYHSSRTCTEPSLILRLSGTALYILNYHGLVHDTQTYRYPSLVDGGMYFLEAVVLFCSQNRLDAVVPCAVDSHYNHNILTGLYSFVATGADALATVRRHHPRWVLKADLRNQPKPLVTRHMLLATEAHDLGKQCSVIHGYCYAAKEDTVAYDEYEWTDGPTTWVSDAKEAFDLLGTTGMDGFPNTTATTISEKDSIPQVLNICFVGDSHSRMLYMAAYMRYQTRFKLEWLMTTYILSHYPPAFDPIAFTERRCSVAVMAFAIWPLMTTHMATTLPYTAQRHLSQTEAMLQRIKQHLGATHVFMRSENINGQGPGVDQCPPVDRRSPPAFDALNRATRQASEAHGFPFIDLDHIIYPMWDAAPDFCHPTWTVFDAEIHHIMHKMFTHIRKQRRKVLTFPAHLFPRNRTDWEGREQNPVQWGKLSEYYKAHPE
jgi:hypothetical protein